MAESKSPEEDAERVLQKQAYTIKRKPENREKNKKRGCEGKGKRSIVFQGEKKRFAYVPILLRLCLCGPVQHCYLFDANAVAGIHWSLTTIKPV